LLDTIFSEFFAAAHAKAWAYLYFFMDFILAQQSCASKKVRCGYKRKWMPLMCMYIVLNH